MSNFADEPPIQSSTPNRPVTGVTPRIDQTPMQREQSSAVPLEESTQTAPLPVADAAPRSEGVPPLRRSTRQKTIPKKFDDHLVEMPKKKVRIQLPDQPVRRSSRLKK